MFGIRTWLEKLGHTKYMNSNQFITNSTKWESVLVLGCENTLKNQTLVIRARSDES